MHSHWSENDIEINGHILHYYRTGTATDSKKHNIVLVHGFSDNGLCWEPVAEELESQFDIVMPDAYGHGKSARVRPGETLDMARDTAELIKALGLRKPIVGGHSMGAGTASQLGARYPQLVTALILEDPAWFMPRPAAEEQRPTMEESPFGHWLKTIQDKTLDEVVEELRPEHPTWPEPYLTHWAEGKKQLDLNFFKAHNPLFENWQQVARAILCPTLLVTADPQLGGIVTPEAARMVSTENPCIRAVNIPDVGHHIRFANHLVYMNLLKEFLKGLNLV